MSRHETATADDFLRLHARRLAADGAPAMAERFLSRLDRCLADVSGGSTGPRRPGTLAVPLTLAEGLARLHWEYPTLFVCVERCSIEGQTLRTAAAGLGVCHRTVRERMVAGVAQLVIWTEIPEANVAAALRQLSTSSAA